MVGVVGYTGGMLRIVLAVVVGAAVVAVTVRLFIVPVSAAAAAVCSIVLPGSVSEDTFNTASDLAMDAGLAMPGVVVAILIARRPRLYPLGQCQRCGDELTGNTSGRCPECGKPSRRIRPPRRRSDA